MYNYGRISRDTDRKNKDENEYKVGKVKRMKKMRSKRPRTEEKQTKIELSTRK